MVNFLIGKSNQSADRNKELRETDSISIQRLIDIFSVSDIGTLGKRKCEDPQQESNL